MNIMIASVGLDPNFIASGGSAEGAAFVMIFAAAGLVLLAVAGRLLRRCRDPHAARYSIPRL